ncbi:hypothetical protein AXG93_2164s1030 [Marchantia polymorpha subsp. ruderalis]|uniref:Uncharacterized protein n=1 Tax=Marchantia polymorpha subsp. ruderalis TaxID=1480154 RepID=A0A176VIQ8_MARPO|nr:hypothetical protein AXG93_2164s1030 [Marchantia polymorpha subsp. ruderalis]
MKSDPTEASQFTKGCILPVSTNWPLDGGKLFVTTSKADDVTEAIGDDVAVDPGVVEADVGDAQVSELLNDLGPARDIRPIFPKTNPCPSVCHKITGKSEL